MYQMKNWTAPDWHRDLGRYVDDVTILGDWGADPMTTEQVAMAKRLFFMQSARLNAVDEKITKRVITVGVGSAVVGGAGGYFIGRSKNHGAIGLIVGLVAAVAVTGVVWSRGMTEVASEVAARDKLQAEYNTAQAALAVAPGVHGALGDGGGRWIY